jgi:hypothetical protein
LFRFPQRFETFVRKVLHADKHLATYARDEGRNSYRSLFKVSAIIVRFYKNWNGSTNFSNFLNIRPNENPFGGYRVDSLGQTDRHMAKLTGGTFKIFSLRTRQRKCIPNYFKRIDNVVKKSTIDPYKKIWKVYIGVDRTNEDR